MLYIKNGIFKDSNSRLDTEDGRSIFNPSPEDWAAEGWVEYVPQNLQPFYQKSFETQKDEAIADAEVFRDDILTNCPSVEDRLHIRLIAEDLLERGYTKAVLEGDEEVDLKKYVAYLKYLTEYEYSCNQVFRTHKKNLENLKTSEELLDYDYTTNYPRLVEFREF